MKKMKNFCEKKIRYFSEKMHMHMHRHMHRHMRKLSDSEDTPKVEINFDLLFYILTSPCVTGVEVQLNKYIQ